MSRFDEIIDRRASDAIKWGKYAGRDVLPLWVADMDFAAPPAVLDALHRRIDHGVFGYTDAWPSRKPWDKAAWNNSVKSSRSAMPSSR